MKEGMSEWLCESEVEIVSGVVEIVSGVVDIEWCGGV